MTGAGRSLKFAGRLVKASTGQLARPYRVNLCVTYLCPSRCRMCEIWTMRPKDELGLDEIEAFARKNPSFSWVQLTGGEPTLRRDFLAIVDAFEETSKPAIYTTQTSSLSPPQVTEKLARGLCDTGAAKVVYTLSLDGPEPVHDFQRGIPGNFKRVMETYERLAPLIQERPGFKVVFGFTITRFNLGTLKDTVAAVRARFPEITEDDFHLNAAQSSGHYYGNLEGAFEADRLEAAAEVMKSVWRRGEPRDLVARTERRFMLGLVDFLRSGKPPLPTSELKSSVYVDSFGVAWPSVMWDLRVGDLRESSMDLAPAWTSSRAKSLRDQIRRGTSPKHWTSCEAYQPLLERMDLKSIL